MTKYNTVWVNCLVAQFVFIFIAFIFSKRKRIKTEDTLIVLCAFCPVPLLRVSSGLYGSIFFGDIILTYFFLKFLISNLLIFRNRFVKELVILFLYWPIFVTILNLIFSINSYKIGELMLHLLRYIEFITMTLYVVIYHKRIRFNLSNILEMQIIIIGIIGIFFLVNYFGLVDLDLFSILAGYEKYYDGFSSFGKGAMFFYKAGVGEFTVLCTFIVLFKLQFEDKWIYKSIYSIVILINITCCIFSGSKQGLFFLTIAIILFFGYFKTTLITKYKLFFMFSFFVTLLSILVLINSDIKEWFFDNFKLFFEEKKASSAVLADRNLQVANFDDKFDNIYFYILGRGLGGDTLGTESDFLNFLGYFGGVGLFLLFRFILYFFKELYKIKNNSLSKLSLLLFSVSVLFGFQQWFITTWGPTNGSNNYLILFYIGIGITCIRDEQTKNYLN